MRKSTKRLRDKMLIVADEADAGRNDHNKSSSIKPG